MPKCVCHRTQTGNSVPCVIHKTVPISELGPGRLIVIGDVHGCHDELQQLLRKVDYQQQDDNLVFVGDLVNKGPKSAQVISHTITQGDSPFKPSERTALAKIITPAAITTILCSVANFTTSPPSGMLFSVAVHDSSPYVAAKHFHTSCSHPTAVPPRSRLQTCVQTVVHISTASCVYELQVVTTVRSLCESSHCWCVRGNHDDAALAARRLLNRNSSSPVKPKYQWVVDLQPEDEEFLMDLPFSLTVKG